MPSVSVKSARRLCSCASTAVIIAHRLSTIMRADKILVLFEGAVVEQGRHDELVERRGMYYQLVQKQLGAQ